MKPTILSFSYKCMKYFRKAGDENDLRAHRHGGFALNGLVLGIFFYIGEIRDISFSLVLSIKRIDLTLENALLLSTLINKLKNKM